MKCPNNLTLKSDRIKYSMLRYVLGDTHANNTWIENKGFPNQEVPFEKLADGSESKLFSRIKEDTDVYNAILVAFKIRQEEFKEKYGDWEKHSYRGRIYENGEPLYSDLLYGRIFEPVSSKQAEQLKNAGEYGIEGINELELEDIVDSLVGDLFTIVDASEMTMVRLKSEYKLKLEHKLGRVREALESMTDEVRIERYRNAIDKIEILLKPDNFNKLMNIVTEVIQESNYSIEDIRKDEMNDYNKELELVDEGVKEVWDDKKKLALHMKDTASFKLKMFLASTPMYKSEMDSEGNVTSSDVPSGSVILTKKHHNHEVLLGELIAALHDNNGNVEDLISYLRKSNRADFQDVGRRLADTDVENIHQIRNAFKIVMDSQYHDNKTLLLNAGFDGKKKKFSNIFMIFSSNRNKADREVRANWRTGTIESTYAGLNKMFKIEANEVSIDYDVMKGRRDQIEEWGKMLKERKDNAEHLEAVVEDIVPEMTRWLEDLGINISKNQMKYILNNPSEYMEFKDRLGRPRNIETHHLFSSQKSYSGENVFYELFSVGNEATELAEQSLSVFLSSTNVFDTRAMKRLATSYIKFNKKLSDSTYMNGENNQVATYGMPSNLSINMKNLKSNKDNVFEDLLNDPFSSTSYWLSNMYYDGKVVSSFMNRFELELFDTFKKKGGYKYKTRVNMSDSEMLVTQLALFVNSGSTDAMRFFPTVFSDKSRDILMKVPKIKINEHSVVYKSEIGEDGDITVNIKGLRSSQL
ncbi:MAG: hypothetical protein U9O94_07900, partial [Nanoarchaeota archaeon]|nr:hypothetical protein [Nanoarchaeota archaeon]